MIGPGLIHIAESAYVFAVFAAVAIGVRRSTDPSGRGQTFDRVKRRLVIVGPIVGFVGLVYTVFAAIK